MRALTGATLILLAACRDDTAPTGPSPSPVLGSRAPSTADATAGSRSGDSLSRWLPNTPGTCLVGTRTPDGRYPSRTVDMPWPARLAAIGNRTTRFAYRGWQAGVPEPVLLAVCTIPDVPGASEFLSAHFGGRAMNTQALRAFAKSAGVTKTEHWGAGMSPHVMPGAAPVYMIDGLASSFPPCGLHGRAAHG